MNDIRFVPHQSIDLSKWDHCISHSSAGCIYAESFFLNAMAGDWHALVYKDYAAVMPLTHRRKWGINYLYQPAFAQQGGIFSTEPLSQPELEAFVSACKSLYRFAEIRLNSSNGLPGLPARTNFVLSLQPSYDTIRSAYKKDLLQNLKSAEKFSLRYEAVTDYETVIMLYRKQYGNRFPKTQASDYDHFRSCAAAAASMNRLMIRSVSLDGEMLATTLFMRDARSIFNLMSVTGAAGREKSANHFLMDQLIREFAGHPLLLDFEGSEIPGIADFYRKFGSSNQPYFSLRYNHLPFPLRLLKK